MIDRMFTSPVFVRHDTDPAWQVASLDDALEYLYAWPHSKRGPIYMTATRACQAAFEGRLPVSSARQAFCAFARSANVLCNSESTPHWAPRLHGKPVGVAEADA